MKPLLQGQVPELQERAKAILYAHWDDLNGDEKDFLCCVYGKKLVFGTDLQKQKVTEIEARFI